MAKKDKCQPLKFENSTEGTEDDFQPTELDPTEDFVNTKGVVFEGEDETFIRGESTVMEFKDQDANNSGSIFSLFQLRNALNNFFSAVGWVSTNVRDAIIEARDTAAGKARTSFVLMHNGVVTDGTFFGFSDLIPGDGTPISFGEASVVEGFIFSNNRSSADYTIYLRKGSETATPFATYTKTNTQRFSDNTLNESFAADEAIYVEYQDDGTNARDVGIVLLVRYD
jgi:hypothetical protein